MPRKDPLAHLRAEPQTPLDQILIAKPKPKRGRSWDKAHRARTYRGVPDALRDQVKGLAADLNVPADEVARAFIEAGLLAMDQDELRLEPRPSAQRMTLFAEGNWKGWQPAKTSTTKLAKKANGSRLSKDHKQAWKSWVGYRFPGHLHAQLAKKARDLNVPIGEILAVLLHRGLEKYARGELALTPTIKAVRMTLQGGGR